MHDPEGRVLIGDLVIHEFDHALPQVLEVLFRADMELPPVEGMRVFEARAGLLGNRLDLLGHRLDPALARLTDAIELARRAYAAAGGPGGMVTDPWHTLVGLDPDGWVRMFANAHGPSAIYNRWLLALVEDDPITVVLRLCALARPEARVRLVMRPDASFTAEPQQRQLVLMQTAADAGVFSAALATSFPEVADLVVFSHLGGDGSPEALLAHARGLAPFRLELPLTVVFHAEGHEAARQAAAAGAKVWLATPADLRDPVAGLARALRVSPLRRSPAPDVAAGA